MIERNKENERELIMEECNHDCSNCSANCDSRDPKSFIEQPHPLSKVKKVVAVLSGKGGVGKSLVTSLLAVNTQRAGYRAAILDADVTGPSIPQAFGIHEKATGTEDALFASESKTGIQMMSINLLLPDETSPVVWRGPVIAGAVKQFWTDVVWKDVDVLYVDMPPGTGDVPLTVMQSIPVDGIVVVTSPQELVGMIVEKAVKMAGLLNVPISSAPTAARSTTCSARAISRRSRRRTISLRPPASPFSPSCPPPWTRVWWSSTRGPGWTS